MAKWAHAHFSRHKEPRSGTSPGFVLLLSISNLIKRKTFLYGSGTCLGGHRPGQTSTSAHRVWAAAAPRAGGAGEAAGHPYFTHLTASAAAAALLLVSRNPGRRALPRARLPVRSPRGGFWVPSGVVAAARHPPWAPAARAHLAPRSPWQGRGAGLSPPPPGRWGRAACPRPRASAPPASDRPPKAQMGLERLRC